RQAGPGCGPEPVGQPRHVGLAHLAEDSARGGHGQGDAALAAGCTSAALKKAMRSASEGWLLKAMPKGSRSAWAEGLVAPASSLSARWAARRSNNTAMLEGRMSLWRMNAMAASSASRS